MNQLPRYYSIITITILSKHGIKKLDKLLNLQQTFRVPFMCFLFTATLFTVIFIFTAQGFGIAESPKIKTSS